MLTSRARSLQDILESSSGIHLSAYIPASNDAEALKHQIQEAIEVGETFLRPALNETDTKAFLEPLRKLTSDKIFLHRLLKGNLAIFRNRDSIRIISLPVEVELQCVVATSFHVKPLLKWLQLEKEFLLVGLANEVAMVYGGNLSSFHHLESVAYPSSDWLADWLDNFTKDVKPLLFLAGDPKLEADLRSQLKYPYIYPHSLIEEFEETQLRDIRSKVNSILQKLTRQRFEQALVEYRHAEELNLAKKNIFQIAKAAVKGKVKKLIVADDIQIFGKLDQRSGGLAIHPVDLDHEDDDLLDDLAQKVLSYGGEVIVASRDNIPKGRPILAILEQPDEEMTINPIENFKTEMRA